jgi:hypothetical protein
MADETQVAEGTDDGRQEDKPFDPIFTRGQYDAVASRIRKETEARYPDYDEIKAKADRLDVVMATAKSDLAEALERAESAEAERDALMADMQIQAWRRQVSEETGIPATLLRGATLDEMTAHAKAIAEAYAESSPSVPIIANEGRQAPATPSEDPRLNLAKRLLRPTKA